MKRREILQGVVGAVAGLLLGRKAEAIVAPVILDPAHSDPQFKWEWKLEQLGYSRKYWDLYLNGKRLICCVIDPETCDNIDKAKHAMEAEFYWKLQCIKSHRGSYPRYIMYCNVRDLGLTPCD